MKGYTEYDAIVIGSGPNGLAAAIVLQQAGCSVLVIEGHEKIGGGLRSAELTLPGFTHDICSAIHPMAVLSPFLSKIPLNEFGLEFIDPPIAAAHPFDDGSAAMLQSSIHDTANSLMDDGQRYIKLMQPIIKDWPLLVNELLAPLHLPKSPLPLLRFGFKAIRSAESLSYLFKGKHARGLWAGMAAHSIQSLHNLSSSAIGLVLLAAGHIKGWPIPKGGSQNIANALLNYFISIGGQVQTGNYVKSLKEIPSSKAVLFDTTPKQLIQIAGQDLSFFYQWQLKNYRYGMGVFKMDFALSAPVPFINEACRNAGTVHLGGTFEEIANSEYQTSVGQHPDKPFVLLAQQSIFDDTRVPKDKHTVWAYCHVPNGSVKDMSEAIENQIERYAPGFRNLIIGKHTMNTFQMQRYNPNYVGGDINGGIIDIRQLFTRPALRYSPYRTSAKGLYICSSSTPPGGGVHGMCGYHAAVRVLKDLFPENFILHKKGDLYVS